MPSVHAPDVAMPSEVVVAITPAMVPLPAIVLKTTVTPGTGLSYTSATRTVSAADNALPTTPD